MKRLGLMLLVAGLVFGAACFEYSRGARPRTTGGQLLRGASLRPGGLTDQIFGNLMVQYKAVMAAQSAAEFTRGTSFGLLQPRSFERTGSGCLQKCGVGGLEAPARQLEIAGQDRLDFLA